MRDAESAMNSFFRDDDGERERESEEVRKKTVRKSILLQLLGEYGIKKRERENENAAKRKEEEIRYIKWISVIAHHVEMC